MFTRPAHNSCRYIVLRRAASGRGEGSPGLPREGGQRDKVGQQTCQTQPPGQKPAPFLEGEGSLLLFLCSFFLKPSHTSAVSARTCAERSFACQTAGAHAELTLALIDLQSSHRHAHLHLHLHRIQCAKYRRARGGRNPPINLTDLLKASKQSFEVLLYLFFFFCIFKIKYRD